MFDKDHSLFTLHCDLQELKDYVSGKSKKKKEVTNHTIVYPTT